MVQYSGVVTDCDCSPVVGLEVFRQGDEACRRATPYRRWPGHIDVVTVAAATLNEM
jgi:hypothetical protein